MRIIKNINRKGKNFSAPTNLKFEYLPSMLQDSNVETFTLD